MLGRRRFPPVVLGMVNLPPLSFSLRSRPGEMLGHQCPGCVSPGLLVICGSPTGVTKAVVCVILSVG